MVGGYTTNKNTYQVALVGGGGTGTKKPNLPTGGTYANGIAGLTHTTPTVKMPNITSQLNSGVVRPVYADGLGYGGGYAGGITKEGVISGGGAVNTTFNSGNKVIKGGLGVTKLPNAGSAQAKYIDYISPDNISSPVKNNTSAPDTPTTDKTTEKPATYEEYLEQQRELLDKRKTEADRQAEAAKERAAVDAQASYAQNMASYGTNAENLAQMGLQGGGYSDYLNAQAYAQKRADVQQANVTEQAAKAQNTATYEDALSEINKSELEYKEKQNDKAAAEDEKKNSIYGSLWEGALNPDSGYTSESIAKIGREYGLSETQIKDLQDIVADTKAKSDAEKQAALKQGALDAINQGIVNESNIGSYLDSLKGQGANNEEIADIRATYQSSNYNKYLTAINDGTLSSTKEIDDAFSAGNLTEKQRNDLKTQYGSRIADDIKQNVSYGDSTNIQAYIDSADKYYKDGTITQSQYQEIYEEYTSNAVIGVSNIDDYQEVKKTLNEYKNSGKLSQEQYNELIGKLNANSCKKLDSSQYSVHGLGSSLVNTDDIDVKINGVTYDLVSGDIVNSNSTKNTLNEVATGNSSTAPSVGTIVVVCGQMYIYKKSRKGTNWHKMGDDSDSVSDAVRAYKNQ